MDTKRAKIILRTAAASLALTAAGCSTQLAPGDWQQSSPAVNGTSVAWEDTRDGETRGTDVYTADTESGTASLAAGGLGEQEQPVISSSYIAWIDQGRLRAKDRSSGAVFNVTTGPATQTDPVLCGSVVAWSDTRAGSPDVYARELPSGAEIDVATSAAVEAYPDCDNGRVVYMYAPTDWPASIRLYDIASRDTTVVSDSPWNQWQPAISGDRVVWQAWPNQPDPDEGIQILGKRLSTGETFTVTSGPGNQTAPVIAGSVVAWEDARNGDMRIWWRDLGVTTPERQADSQQPGHQQAPALYGRMLAYQSDATGMWNIYTVPLLNLFTP